VSILFKVNDYTADLEDEEAKIIDDFFESLKLDKLANEDQITQKLPFGKLMHLVDMNDRWVY